MQGGLGRTGGKVRLCGTGRLLRKQAYTICTRGSEVLVKYQAIHDSGDGLACREVDDFVDLETGVGLSPSQDRQVQHAQ